MDSAAELTIYRECSACKGHGRIKRQHQRDSGERWDTCQRCGGSGSVDTTEEA